jgi:hypothetical protein
MRWVSRISFNRAVLNEMNTQVRGDLSNPQVKAGKEGAFKESVEWLKEHI